MSQLDLNEHLTTPNPDLNAKVSMTHKGQAHFAGTGPSRETCRTCANWNWRAADYYASNQTLKPQRCLKYSKFMAGQHGPTVPHSALACKYHEAHADAPPVKNRRK